MEQLINQKLKKGQTYIVKVKTKAQEDKITMTEHQIQISVTAPPYKNMANVALIKVLKKKWGVSAKIIRGHQSKVKTILIE